MKKTLLIALIYLIGQSFNASAQSCCDKDPSWVAMAGSKSFRDAHQAPFPVQYTPAHGSIISFKTPDSKDGRAFYLPSDQATSEVLIIFHEWWGLNDYIKMEAEKLQKMLGNIDVYAVDLYDGKVAVTPEEGSKLAKALDGKRSETIIKGLLEKIGQDKEIATLGWCMGGSWSFTAARLADKQAKACVMYYGFPEQDEKKVGQIKCDILYIWGAKDQFITQKVVTEFQASVEATGNKFSLYTFNADHAFANPSNPQHDPQATEQAQLLTIKFLKEKLRLE